MECIAIIYPTYPNYRHDFFDLLHSRLLSINCKLVIIVGDNIIDKDIKECECFSNFTVIKLNRIGFSLFGFRVEWKIGLLNTLIRIKPQKTIFMFNAGIINYSLAMIYLFFIKKPFFIWGSGYQRVGLSNFQHRIKDRFKRFFMSLSSGFISYSDFYAKKLYNSGYNQNKIFVARNTINIERLLTDISQSSLPKSAGIFRFLYVGALIKGKRLDTVLHACKLVRNVNTFFQFDIIGNGSDFESLSMQARNLYLDDYVIFHGAKYGKELQEFFLKANAFVLPGTGGLALNEAMVYSLPIIATPGDGTGYDLICDNINGFLLSPDYDVSELAEKMLCFLNFDSSVLENMGKRSKYHITRNYTLNNMVNQFYNAIHLI
jgi:glycosyltransferase involved in cell wall biosynthesis